MSIFYSFPKKFGKTFTISKRRPADRRFSENYSFPVQNYADYCGDMVIRAYRDLIIDEGITVTTDNPCKGLYIYCDGDCIINGTLSMTARGAKFDPQGEGFGCKPKCEAFLNVTFSYPYTAEQLEDYIRRYIQSIAENGMPQAVWPAYIINNIYTIPEGEEDLAVVPAVGASGGASVKDKVGNAGSNGTLRKSGGGGSGGSYGSTYNSGAGGDGTAYSGGAGGGGARGVANAEAGSSIGGKGGYGTGGPTFGGGGGAGNPGGAKSPGSSVYDGGLGTGGLIILVVRGNLTIGANGIIESKGVAGGNAGSEGAGGGGSGGGSINIFYGGNYTKTGQVLATGGAGGTATYRAGGKGGDGCITEQQI